MKTETDELVKKRLLELAKKSDLNHIATFTGFMGMAEMAVFYEVEQEISYVPYKIWGGYDDSERVIIRFGEEWDFPITCIEISPLQKKFAEELTHRDFLGALMNLGIERNTLGDILLEEQIGYVFCLKSMAEYMIKELTRIRHTPVKCRICEEIPLIRKKEPSEVMIQASSERIDGIVAKVYHLSRNDSLLLFRQQKIFCNGKLCENNSQVVKTGDKITVRGHGKFSYEGIQGISKKGKMNARILVW